MNGDGLPDLVSPNSVVEGTKQPHGGTHWRIYLNGGSGFDEAVVWDLSDVGGDVDRGFWNTFSDDWGIGNENWTMLDINGDGRSDLVSPYLVFDINGGTKQPHGFPSSPHWRVYLNVP